MQQVVDQPAGTGNPGATGARTQESASSRRGVAVLLANSALMSAGFYMLIPLLSVHLTQDLGFTGVAAGAVLAVRQLTQQGLMLFGGALADRVGYRPIIAAGMLIRALGFFGFALGDSLALVLASAVVAALGGALFEATGKAALASLVAPERRTRMFSLSALSGSIGSTGGPILGAALLHISWSSIGVASGSFFLLAAVLSALLLPAVRGGGEQSPPFGVTVRAIAHDRPFLLFTVLLTGYWFLHNQIYISVPLRAVQVAGGPEIVSVLYTVNALAALALQYPLVNLLSRRRSSLALVGIGVAVMGLGLGVMALAPSISPATSAAGADTLLPGWVGGVPWLAGAVLVAAVLVFAAGRALVEPSKDDVTAVMAPPDSLAVYFGVSFLSLAVGGSLGNVAGGWLMDVATASGVNALPWLIFALAGAGIGAAVAASRSYLLSAYRIAPAPG